MPDLPTRLRAALQARPAVDLSATFANRACVALLLRGETDEDLELGYIRRATGENDRWSGQLAFPGGKRDRGDADDFATARREVREELGIELFESEHLGRLGDLQARRRGQSLDFFVRPLVFHLRRDPAVTPNESEVAEFFWFPVRELENPARVTRFSWQEGSTRVDLPALQLVDGIPLWGLTYLMTLEFLDVRGREKSPGFERGMKPGRGD